MENLSRFAKDSEQKRQERDMELYREFEELTKDPEVSRMKVTNHLMKKYKLRSASTVWNIRKRVEQTLKES